MGIFFISYDGSVVARIGRGTRNNPTRNETKPGSTLYIVDGSDPSEAARLIARRHGAECLVSDDESMLQENRLTLAKSVAKTLKEISSSIDEENAKLTAVQEAIFQILYVAQK